MTEAGKERARRAAVEAHRIVRKAGQQQLKAITLMQNVFRAARAFKELAKAKKAALTIQASCRGKQMRRHPGDPRLCYSDEAAATAAAERAAHAPPPVHLHDDPIQHHYEHHSGDPRLCYSDEAAAAAAAERAAHAPPPSRYRNGHPTLTRLSTPYALQRPLTPSSLDFPCEPPRACTPMAGLKMTVKLNAEGVAQVGCLHTQFTPATTQRVGAPEGEHSLPDSGLHAQHGLGLGAWASDSSISAAERASPPPMRAASIHQSSSRDSTSSNRSRVVANTFGQRCTTPMANFVQVITDCL